jgi:hypothetical protein
VVKNGDAWGRAIQLRRATPPGRPECCDELLRPAAASAATSCSVCRSALLRSPGSIEIWSSDGKERHGRAGGDWKAKPQHERKTFSSSTGGRSLCQPREHGRSGALSAAATHRPPHDWSCMRERKMNWMRMMPAAVLPDGYVDRVPPRKLVHASSTSLSTSL